MPQGELSRPGAGPWALAVAAALLAALGLLAGLGGSDAAAQEDPAGEPRGAVEIILDSSESMSRDDGSGQVRIDSAKQAIGELVGAIPEGSPVGLRVFGGRENPTDRERCLETNLEVPVGPLDPDSFIDTVNGFEPLGRTPIALALSEAAKDLPSDGERVIVLVSDGKDSCVPPDPCDVAADLAQQGIDLRIQAIGFEVDAAARRQLQCIARVTGGIYRDASDADSLRDSLIAAVTRGLRGYQTEGEPVDGTPSRADAPPIYPGQFVDTIRPGETKWYSLDVPEGVAMSVSQTIVPPLPRLPVSATSVGGNLSAAIAPPAEQVGEADITEVDPVGSVDLEFTTSLYRDLASGEPVTINTRTESPADGQAEVGEHGVAITLDDSVGDLPDRVYPLEIAVQQAGTAIELEEVDGTADEEAGAAGGSSEGSGPSGATAAIVALVTLAIGALGGARLMGKRRAVR